MFEEVDFENVPATLGHFWVFLELIFSVLALAQDALRKHDAIMVKKLIFLEFANQKMQWNIINKIVEGKSPKC